MGVAHSMHELNEMISRIPIEKAEESIDDFSGRSESLFTTTISAEAHDGYEFVGKSLPAWSKSRI